MEKVNARDVTGAELLLRAGAAVSLKAKNGLTALQYAIENGADNVAELLRRSSLGNGGTR
jgi:ankyrin repeat protein